MRKEYGFGKDAWPKLSKLKNKKHNTNIRMKW